MGAHTPFEVREFPVTATPSGYGRSRLIASGVCGTDVHFYRGTLAVGTPSIIGHEFVGQLEDCDAAEAATYGLKVGDAVIANIAVPCGTCPLCLAGDQANCVRMGVTNGGSVEEAPYLWGGYTEVNYTPLSNLVKIPASLDAYAVATFACPGPTAMHAFALAARAGVDVTKAKVAVIQGLGPVGCYAALYLKTMGVPKVYAVTGGRNPARDQKLRCMGVDDILHLREEGEEAAIARLAAENDGLGADLCFEASGAPAAVPFGLQILRNRGVYLIPGQYSQSGGITIQPQWITFKALHIIGSSQYDMTDVRAYLDFLAAHPEVQAHVLSLGSRYAVEDVNQAFADAMAGKNIKTLLAARTHADAE